MSEAAEYLRSHDDTIVAISSPLGSAPRGVLRLSGPDAVRIVARLLLRDGNPVNLDDLVWGARPVSLLIERGATVSADLWLMRAPHSYTGENVVEVHLPGSPALLDMTVERCRLLGARPALPGEFTERAFRNGRLDLAQAEAVAAVIHAESEEERKAAWTVLDGRASRELDSLAVELTRVLATIELDLDFSDQDIEIVVPEDLDRDLGRLELRVDRETSLRRRLPQSGTGNRVLLIGRVNAGKSSLFNALQADQRALVSDQAGTTRDYLEAEIDLSGRRFLLIDCAGEGHEVLDVDRQAGEFRARESARADALIEVVDGRSLDAEFEARPGALLVLATRADLVPVAERPELGLHWVSTVTGEGLEELRLILHDRLRIRGSGALVHLAARQGRLLERAGEAISRARLAAAEELGSELVACDLHDALAALREITGVDYDDEVLSAIMRDFCIGK